MEENNTNAPIQHAQTPLAPLINSTPPMVAQQAPLQAPAQPLDQTNITTPVVSDPVVVSNSDTEQNGFKIGNVTVSSVPPQQTQPTGLNTNTVMPMKNLGSVDTSKGIWKWISKIFGLDKIAAKIKVDMQTAQTYATQYNYTYEYISQQVPTGPSGVGSVILSTDGSTVYYHHLRGTSEERPIDLLMWPHTTFRSGDDSETDTMSLTIMVGRITIPENLPSVIVGSRSNGLHFFDPAISKKFNNVQAITLEGNFNQYFDVFAPAQNGATAFETLPPNVMAYLLDHNQDATIEFVGDSIYLFLVTNKLGGPINSDPKILPGSVYPVPDYRADKPSFIPEVCDDLTKRLTTLADFFADLPHSTQPNDINANDVITNKQVKTVYVDWQPDSKNP